MNPFLENHSNAPFQLFVAISGETREHILQELIMLVAATRNSKPCQGIKIESNRKIEIVTPKWEGRVY